MGHSGSLTIHANNAEAALWRLANCAMQDNDNGALPWEVTCRIVADGIVAVIHLTHRMGRGFVEKAIEVAVCDTATKRFSFAPVQSRQSLAVVVGRGDWPKSPTVALRGTVSRSRFKGLSLTIVWF